MKKIEEHNALCRAFRALNLDRRAGNLIGQLTHWFAIAKQLGSTVAIDSTIYDAHYRGRRYEQRCGHYASRQKLTANAERSRSARLSPKLGIGVCTRSHLVLSGRPGRARLRTPATSSCCYTMPDGGMRVCEWYWLTADTIRKPTTASPAWT